MTKDELITVLGIAGVDPKIVEAMTQSYEMGFDHGAKVGEQMREVLIEAAAVLYQYDAGQDPSTDKFWATYNQLRAMQ